MQSVRKQNEINMASRPTDHESPAALDTEREGRVCVCVYWYLGSAGCRTHVRALAAQPHVSLALGEDLCVYT